MVKEQQVLRESYGQSLWFSKCKFQYKLVTPCVERGLNLLLFMDFSYLLLSWGLLFPELLYHALQQKFYCFGGWRGSCGTFLTAHGVIHRGNFFQMIFAWSSFNELRRVRVWMNGWNVSAEFRWRTYTIKLSRALSVDIIISPSYVSRQQSILPFNSHF